MNQNIKDMKIEINLITQKLFDYKNREYIKDYKNQDITEFSYSIPNNFIFTSPKFKCTSISGGPFMSLDFWPSLIRTAICMKLGENLLVD